MTAIVVLANTFVMTHNYHFFFVVRTSKKKKKKLYSACDSFLEQGHLSSLQISGNKSILAILQITFKFAKYCQSSQGVRLSKPIFKANGSNDKSF